MRGVKIYQHIRTNHLSCAGRLQLPSFTKNNMLYIKCNPAPPGFFIFREVFLLLQTIVQFLRDDRGAAVPAALLPLAAGTGLGFLAAHGLHHHLAHGLGVMPDGLGSLDPGAAVPVVAGMKNSGWEWNCGGRVLLAERNVARDAKLAWIPEQGENKTAAVHTGEKIQAITWQWPGDNRVFLVPSEVLDALARNVSLTKDVIIAVGHLFKKQHYPENRMFETSYRQLAELLALRWAGKRLIEDLDDALTLARWLTIRNHPVIRKLYPDGRIKELSHDTFGFIDRVSRIEIRDGHKIPRNRQPLEVCLSEMYAFVIKKLPAAPVPVAAIELAHKSPQRLRTPVKSLVYYLASRVPLKKIQLSLTTLAGILGYRNQRKDKLRRANENVLKILYPIMIRDFQNQGDGDVYEIILAGKHPSNGT